MVHRQLFYILQIQWSRPLMTSSVQRSDHLFVHRDTAEDRADAKFEFTAENEKVG